jgi:hypothetical protein
MKLYKVVSFACLLGISPLSQEVAFSQQLQPPQSVTLAWSPSPDASVTGYNLYYGRTFIAPTNRMDVGAALTATVTNLEPGLAYFFFATAYDASGVESEPSNLITHTPTAGPATPSDLIVEVETARRVSLQWQNNASDVDGFHIERSLDGINYVNVGTVNAGETVFRFSDNKGFSVRTYPYWFRVSAFKGSLVSVPSIPATAVTNRADLVINSVSFTPSAPVAGASVLFRAEVRNQGAAHTPQGVSVMVGFSVNGQPAVAWCYLTNALSPGAKTTVTAQQGPLGLATWVALAGLHSVTATVDLLDYLDEPREDNNQFATSMAVPLANAPAVSLALNRSVVSETDLTGAIVTVSRSGSTTAPLTVTLNVGGTARSGADFAPVPTVVVIPVGATSVTIPLNPIHNLKVSPEKTVTLALAPSVDYQHGSTPSVTLRITNQDVDSDGDGMSNAAEQLAGTGVNDPDSYLSVHGMTRDSNGQLTMHWGSVPGIGYRVLYASSLDNPDWIPISPVIVSAGGSTSWTFTPTNSMGVYGLGF